MVISCLGICGEEQGFYHMGRFCSEPSLGELVFVIVRFEVLIFLHKGSWGSF